MAKDLIKINGVKEVNGMKFHEIEGGFGENKKSILAKEIASIHNRKLFKVNELINSNRIRFKDNIDIIDLKGTEFAILLMDSGIYTQNSINASNNIYLLSERGYSKLLKIMNDDLAWKKYDELVNNYFKMRETIKNNDKLKKPRQKKVVTERIADYTITGMRKTLENSKYFEIEKNINDIIQYHRNLSIKSRDKAYRTEEFKDKTKYVNLIKNKIVRILEDIREQNKDYVLRTVISKLIEDLLKELKTSNNISSSIKIKNLKNAIEKKDNTIALLNPPKEKFLDLEFYGFSFNDMYHYYKDKVKRTVEYNNWMFDFPYDKVVASFNDVDLTKPAALFVKYVAPASNDVDNFVKSTQDAVAGALGCNDNKIYKVNAERVGYCDKIEDGKILVFLRNLTDEEINQNKLI